MKRRITLRPGDKLAIEIRGGPVTIPEHHTFTLYAEMDGKLNITTERCRTQAIIEKETLGWCARIVDA